MATKKSTTGKTKTTKSRAAKSTPTKTTTKKATPKKVTKTTAAAVSTKQKSKLLGRLRGTRATSASADSLRRIHLISVLLFVVLAIAAGTIMKTTSYPLTLGHLGRDSLASRTETVYAAAQEPIMDLELRWVLVAVLAVAALFSLLFVSRLSSRYKAGVQAGVSKLRWIEMAITSAIMVELVAVLSGVGEIMTLKLIGGLMVTTSALAWLAERETAAKRYGRAPLFIGMFTAVLPWLLIAAYAIGTVVYGGIRTGWYVYALYAVSILGGLMVMRNLRKTVNGSSADYSLTERTYITSSLLVKAAFALVLIIGLRR